MSTSHSDVHPSAIGSNVQPTTAPNETGAAPNQAYEGYPEQRHAGALGIGPNYGDQVRVGEKITGLKEEAKGKLTNNSDLVERGRKRRTGELKSQEKEAKDEDPFTTPEEKEEQRQATQGSTESGGHSSSLKEKGEKEQAATISPEGTEQAQHQREGGNTENMKYMSGKS
ncbi:hypothetical protein SERLA73DRAFT_188304 [Serpula lacrymans var. lacrymans S7.3]|uniref:Uncharacterized protein n=2 Tax=Serpula lacrymans var. lacrymans TaxID=341189 RepID=F8QB32_SERL3|nr:uncharacterized protein SERLADRAFT_478368 [Serpula lacrymans var. lacrymans S7.9]EGN94418.1 hypothetical protein SERLA73DRAFT_188304 [Serpula lacrymans var. lacrymans S7.3]EGO19899.1 hypothetical protein SERLADRAFT_478368 [Serpula lacrymans var. lacrymans S7.9]